MNRLIEKTVFCGFVTAWRFATWPTSRSPSFVNATTDGVTRPPSAFGMTTGSPPSITATTEFVVPRSIPIIFSAISVTPQPEGNDAGRYRLVARAKTVPGEGASMAARHAAVEGEQGPTGLHFPACFRTRTTDRKSTRLNSSHVAISYAVFCLKKKKH